MDTLAPLPNLQTFTYRNEFCSLRSHVDIWLIGVRTGVSEYFLDLVRQAAFTIGKLPQVFASIYIYLQVKHSVQNRDKAPSALNRQLYVLY